MWLGWKVLVPASLLWILLIFAIRAFRNSGGSTAALIIALVIGVAVVVMAAFLVPDKNGPQEQVVELASDYPVPPLDLAVPSRPRHQRSTGPRQAEMDNTQQVTGSRQRK
ncbi:hypothetical protein [uncultured Pseudonocardia sp.]|uniref:hypothetical protein n=1 Tax=uncultured Pseudonocardia sp. TaxID=211455 RepID=UPI0026203981|nr:hypothetical protein [uncultured Pseudonocardia sp.]